MIGKRKEYLNKFQLKLSRRICLLQIIILILAQAQDPSRAFIVEKMVIWTTVLLNCDFPHILVVDTAGTLASNPPYFAMLPGGS